MAIAYVNKTSTVNSTSTTTTVVSTPSAISVGHRLVALVGCIGTGNTVTGPAGWIKFGEFAPTTSFKTAAYYRDVTGTETPSYTWGWSVGGRNFGDIVAYSGCDLAQVPLFQVTSGVVDSAGPHAAPAVSVVDGGWLITAVAARQSPGTNGAVTWSSTDTSDAERFDATAVNTGGGAQLPSAFYDSNRALSTAGSGGGGGGAGSLPAGTAPLNKYNQLYLNRGSMLVGQTNAIDYLEDWRARLAGLSWMRVFPNSGALPAWTDDRIKFCQDFDAMPFLSTKSDGSDSKIAATLARLEAMPSWIKSHPDPNFRVWITDRHEPEGDIAASAFVANITKFINKINTLSSPVRARVWVGPVLTRQWTENTSGRSYKTHDCGPISGCNFLGIDMYANSWQSPYPDPATFLSKAKAYRYDSTDTRPRVFPELGAVGMPFDTDGKARAAWMQGIQDQLIGWSQAAQGWPFKGWCWWNEQGKSGDSVSGIGTRRWFQFDRRHNGQPYTYTVTDPDTGKPKSVTDPEGGFGYLPIDNGSAPGSGVSSGSTPAARQLTASATVNQVHLWSISLAPTVTAGVSGNAWTHVGVPIG